MPLCPHRLVLGNEKQATYFIELLCVISEPQHGFVFRLFTNVDISECCKTFQSFYSASIIVFQLHMQAVSLQNAFHSIPHPNAEYMTRHVAAKLGQNLYRDVSNLT